MPEPLRIEISAASPGEWRVVKRSHHAAENIFRVGFIEAELSELLDELGHCLMDANASLELQCAHLRRLSGRLAELVLPMVLREKIAVWKSAVEFFVDDSAMRIPVELFPNGETVLADAVPVSRHWFCESIVPTDHEDGKSGVQALIIADPAGTLPEAQSEGESVFRFLRSSGNGWNCRFLGQEVTVAELSRELPNTDLIHLAAHYTSDESKSTSGVVMSDGLWLPWGLSLAPRLVFANCCRAGLAAHGSDLSLAGRFLKQGSRHVVAPFLPVSDRVATLFAKEFYRSLAKGMEVSQAVWRARKTTGPPGWIYWHFGPAEEHHRVQNEQGKRFHTYPLLVLLAIIVFYFVAASLSRSDAPESAILDIPVVQEPTVVQRTPQIIEEKNNRKAVSVMGQNPPDDF